MSEQPFYTVSVRESATTDVVADSRTDTV